MKVTKKGVQYEVSVSGAMLSTGSRGHSRFRASQARVSAAAKMLKMIKADTLPRPNQFSRVKWLDKPDQIPGQGVQKSAPSYQNVVLVD